LIDVNFEGRVLLGLFLLEKRQREMNQRILRRGNASARPHVRQVAPGTGVFEGFASLFHRRDQAGDVVMPGAFASALKKKGCCGIRMLFNHDAAEPVGTWVELKEMERGLFVRGRLDRKVQRGAELHALLESGGLDGLSIGFKTVSARRDNASKARRLLEIDLWEISLVTFPMLDGARVTQVKSRAWANAEKFFSPGIEKPTGEIPTWI
jgi:HK97 family phage prohead protease